MTRFIDTKPVYVYFFVPLTFSSCSKKVVTQPGAVTVGVERVNGTQLSATVHYSTVELPDNITIGQLTLQPAKFGVHYTGSAGSLTFTTSDVSNYTVDLYVQIPLCDYFLAD